MTEAILRLLLSLPPCFYEPTPELADARRARLEILAEELHRGALSPETLVGIVTVGEFETHYARYVGEGRCTEGRFKCDPDPKGVPQARTYFQLWKATCRPAWEEVEGSRAELRAAIPCAAARWKEGLRACRTVRGAFSAYRAVGCGWVGAPAREKRYYQLLARFRRLSS